MIRPLLATTLLSFALIFCVNDDANDVPTRNIITKSEMPTVFKNGHYYAHNIYTYPSYQGNIDSTIKWMGMAGIDYEEIWAEVDGVCFKDGIQISPAYGFLARISKDMGPIIHSPLAGNQPWLTKIDFIVQPSEFYDCDSGRKIIHLTRK